jgi:putative DNA primase/helicase
MEFLSFCKAHGILIDYVPPVGVWRRFPTDDHPRSKNGAVKYMGDHAFVQNHAIDTEVSIWKSDSPVSVNRLQVARDIRDAENKKMEMQRKAMRVAAEILKDCRFGKHDYLKAKGFPDEEGNIYVKDGEHFLVVPMRAGRNLVGCQLIDQAGGKKFLFGQRSSGAEFCFDNKGMHVLCEGYATALSVRLALKSLKKRYKLHVCFSAGNMKKVAGDLKPDSGLVVADNDLSGTGERVAKEIGWNYWISDKPGEDANDAHQRMGLFRFSQSLLDKL